MTWSHEKQERVRELAAKGKSASQIGTIIGTTRNSVIGWCHRNGIVLQGRPSPPCKLTEADVRGMVQMRESGKTYAAIGAKYGVHNSHVYYIFSGRIKVWRPLVAALQCGRAA